METNNLLNLLEKIEPGIVLFDNDFNVKFINQALLLIFPQVPKTRFSAPIFWSCMRTSPGCRFGRSFA